MSKVLEIKSCRDCPRFKKRKAGHFLMGNETGFIYTCTKAERDIYPSDGVKPPPTWCPLDEGDL